MHTPLEILDHYGENNYDGQCPKCGGVLDDTRFSLIVWFCRKCHLMFKSDHHGGIYAFRIPEFIRLRGCGKCPNTVGKQQCTVCGCDAYGKNVDSPFYDPAYICYITDHSNPLQVATAKEYLDVVNSVFGKCYSKMGINLRYVLLDSDGELKKNTPFNLWWNGIPLPNLIEPIASIPTKDDIKVMGKWLLRVIYARGERVGDMRRWRYDDLLRTAMNRNISLDVFDKVLTDLVDSGKIIHIGEDWFQIGESGWTTLRE